MRPYLSVVVPVLNEEGCIASFIDRMRAELSARAPSWEIVVVDDGSTDRTREIVEAHVRADERVRLIAGPHRGKGGALREGMLAASGAWRFMADADLAMPPGNLQRVLDGAAAGGDAIIGSREAPGSRRVGEPWPRHVIGRAFNRLVRLLAVPGIEDTQCGFKLFSARAVEAIFPRLTVAGFAFDVEVLFLARRAGIDVREVGIEWHARGDSRVAVGRGAAAFADILRIRWRWRNRFAMAAWVVTGIFAGALAYDLMRMPVQVYDALGEILDAQRSPSPWESFKAAASNVAYFRPLRIAQIKMIFDAADGHVWLAYRGVHAALLVACFGLFTRAMRVRSAADLSAALLALTVLMGLHTFPSAVREAFPINHFLEVMVFCLLTLNLAQSRGGVLVDVAAAVTFAAAALTLESGLLVWVVAVAAWITGLRGISGRGLAALTILLAGYFYARFVYFSVGSAGLLERSSAWFLDILEPSQLQERFGGNPLPFYAYNVVASALSVLFSEPQSGLFRAVGEATRDGLWPRTVIAVLTSLLTTPVVAWAALRELRARPRAREGSLVWVFAAVLAASAAMSFAYTKDDIMSVAGAFYALAVYAAVRSLLGQPWRPVPAAALGLVLVTAAAGWAVRSAGVHHTLRLQAFKQRVDWALLLSRGEAPLPPPGDARAWRLTMRLRDEALAMEAPNPWFHARWANALWGD